MKCVKRITACLVVIGMLMAAFSVCSAKTLETVTMQEKNVALEKPVYAAATTDGGILTNGSRGDRLDPSFCSYSSDMVELPTGDLVAGAESAATDWYIIDLEEAYKLKEVRLYSRGDEPTTTDNWMGEFVIEVSNSILFPEDGKVVLGGIGATIEGTGVTSRDTPFTATLDGVESYRYIRIRKTAWTYFGWAELEAYADVEVVDPYGNATFKEVSRNKPAEVNYGSYYDGETVGSWSPDKVVDGIFSANHGWIVDGVADRPSGPYNLLVDLENDMPITKIEMFGRPGSDHSVFRNNWKVYGFTEEEGKPDISGEISGGRELLSVTSPFPQITDTVSPDADDGLSQIVDNSVPIRYLVFSKVANELACLCEVRAFIVMPEALEAEMISTSKAQIKLSEKADIATAPDGIEVMVGGTKIVPQFSMSDDVTLEIDLGQEYFDKQISININNSLKSMSGVEFFECAFELYSPKAVNAQVSFFSTAQGSGSEIALLQEAVASGGACAKVVVENNTEEEAADVIVLAVLYNDKNFVVASKEQRVTVEPRTSQTITAGFALPAEVTSSSAGSYKMKTFVWRDYNILKPWISNVVLGG